MSIFRAKWCLIFLNPYNFICTYKWEEKEQNTKATLGANNEIFISKQNKPYIDAYFNQPTYSVNDLNQEILKPSATITKQALESATFITPQLTQRLRFHLMYMLNKTWTFQSRLELSTFNDKINGRQNGIMLYQDIAYNPMMKPYAFSARIAVFDVQNFDGRIYAYESDVLYSFSVPALYNTGLRYYLNAQYKINKHFQIWAKFAHTLYTDVKEIRQRHRASK
ncbi:MAG: hypothetical protein LRY27_04645 [Chitinophagales bacterium]|nr:hypothetical protein [Chitinophagales bacterium]